MATEVYAADMPGFVGNLFIRRMDFVDAGDYVTGHDHGVDHVTFVSQGCLHVTCSVTGMDEIVLAPAWIFTPAKSRHQMTAVEARSRAWCIFVNTEPSEQTSTARFS